MRFSRAWLAAVPALAIALTGGAAVAAAAAPAPVAAKGAAETARAVREPAAGAAHTRAVVFNCAGQPQVRPGSPDHPERDVPAGAATPVAGQSGRARAG